MSDKSAIAAVLSKRSAIERQKRLDTAACSIEHYHMAKRKFVPVVDENPQSREAIHGRGASWSPANRFEKLHLDLTDVDLIDEDPDSGEKPRRATQYFRDATKTIIAHNQSPDVGSKAALIRTAVASMAAFTASRGRRTSISDFPPDSISNRGSW